MRLNHSSFADAATGRIEAAEWLDGPAFQLGNAVALPQRLAGTPGKRVRNALHGTWYVHPVHPMLVTVPIGTWTLALGLDTLGALGAKHGQEYDRAADLAVQAGAAGAVAAAGAGLMDLSQTFCFRVSATDILVTVVEVALFKGRHFDRSVILLCVRWYLAYNLSLRNLKR